MEIAISDTGQGISAEFLPYVFDRFRQADSSSTRRHGGLGLGLAIANQVVELHRGSIRVESLGEGQGTTFTVRLPLTSLGSDEFGLQNNPSGEDIAFPIPASQLLEGTRVLIVDDEADSREVLALILEPSGAEVKTASSVAQALEVLKSWKPHIIIADIGMPREDGYSLIRKVRSLDREDGGTIPAVALTAYARMEDRQQALSAGFQRHATKPVDPAELISIVASLAWKK